MSGGRGSAPPLRDRSRWRHRGRAFRAVLQLAVLHLLVESAEQAALGLVPWGRSRSFLQAPGPLSQEPMAAFGDRTEVSSPVTHFAGYPPAFTAAPSPSGLILVLRGGQDRWQDSEESWDGKLSPGPDVDDHGENSQALILDAKAAKMMGGMRFAKSVRQHWLGDTDGHPRTTPRPHWPTPLCAIDSCAYAGKYGVTSRPPSALSPPSQILKSGLAAAGCHSELLLKSAVVAVHLSDAASSILSGMAFQPACRIRRGVSCAFLLSNILHFIRR